MKPRSILRALAPVLLLLAVSCARDATDVRPYDYLIGVSLANLTEPWRITMRDEIMTEASRFGDVHVVFTDAADSSSRQIQDVRTLLDYGIDLLIISPNDSEALSPVIAEAYHHIPVILLDRSVVGFDYTLFIGPDNRSSASRQGNTSPSCSGQRAERSSRSWVAPDRPPCSTEAWGSVTPSRRPATSPSSTRSSPTGCATRRRTRWPRG